MEVFVLVERKKSVAKGVLAWLCMCLGIACVLLACYFQLLFIIGVLLIGLWYWLWMMGGLEYEYSYFDGDLRFAKVMNKSRRKTLKGYSIEDVIQIAPAGDRSVYNYENDNNVSVKDYTSKIEGVPYYDIVLKDKENNSIMIIKAELDDKYLDAVCIKNGYKVKRRPEMN